MEAHHRGYERWVPFRRAYAHHSAVSFPLLLDHDVGAAVALLTSIRVVAANPVTMALWGLIVTALLVIGLVPFFLGLTVMFPVLGHTTWHLYRKAVEPDPDLHPDYQPRLLNCSKMLFAAN